MKRVIKDRGRPDRAGMYTIVGIEGGNGAQTEMLPLCCARHLLVVWDTKKGRE